MRKELPIWVVVIVIVVAVVIVGAIFWRTMKPLPEIVITPEMEAQMGEAMRRAFELKEPPEKYGSKIVPSPLCSEKVILTTERVKEGKMAGRREKPT